MTDRTQGKIPQKSLCYFVTSNNPQKHYPCYEDFDFMSATPEQHFDKVVEMCKPFLFPKKHAPRDPSINGVLAVAEIAPKTGTYHVHQVFCNANKMYFSNLRKLYPHSDIRKAYGTAQQNRDYIFKQGKHEGKRETQCCEPYVFGKFFGTDSDAIQVKSRSALEQIEEMFDSGMRPDEILRVPRWAYYKTAIETAWAARNNVAIPLKKRKRAYYHFGESGAGKSHLYIRLCEQMGERNVCKCDSGKHMMEKFDYENYIVLDELKGDHVRESDCDMGWKQLLQLLDEYQLDLERRYFNKTFLPSEVHITSIYAPEELYNLPDGDSVDQLLRRLSGVVYHWRDAHGDRREYLLENPECPDSGLFYPGRKALIDEALADGGRIVERTDYGYGAAEYSGIY